MCGVVCGVRVEVVRGAFLDELRGEAVGVGDREL
jgi:hypothetical protein